MKIINIFLNLIIVILSTVILLTLVSIVIIKLCFNDSTDNNNRSQNITTNEVTSYLIKQNIDNILIQNFSDQEMINISISIYIPSKDIHYTYNPSKSYINASTIKVPLNMYIYNLAQNNPEILNKQLTYYSKYYEEGAGIMQSTPVGTTFDVQTLLTYSIVYSDNIATNILIEEFIKDKNTYAELIPYFGNADYENKYSTSENKMYALKLIYNNQELYAQLIDDMEHSIYRDRLPYYIDEKAIVAVKTGDINETTHDMGIIFNKPNDDYLIVISMVDIKNCDEKTATLSNDIYNIINTIY